MEKAILWNGWRGLFTLTLGLAAAGCASGPAEVPDWGGAGNPQEDIRVWVDNQNTSDATIYAVWGAGNRIRLGQVMAKSEGMFTTRWRSPDLRMEIRLLAAGTYGTNQIPVDPGDELELILTPGMDRYRPIR
jgi:hypothetical protein